MLPGIGRWSSRGYSSRHACAACGFIVGVAAMTGVGSVLAHNIMQFSGGIIFVALLLVWLPVLY